MIPHREIGNMKTLFDLIAAELYKHGKVDAPQATSIALADANPVLALYVIFFRILFAFFDTMILHNLVFVSMASQNMLYQAKRATAMGWKPTHATFQETIADDIALALASMT